MVNFMLKGQASYTKYPPAYFTYCTAELRKNIISNKSRYHEHHY